MYLPRVLVCAATDPTNGAGLVADCLTLQSLGIYPLGVVTAVTAQDTVGVKSVYPLSVASVRDQWRVLVDDIVPQAIKVGMVGTGCLLEAVCNELSQLDATIPVVIDPVLASGRGDLLSDRSMHERYRHLSLIQHTVLLTPNYKEFYQIMGASEHISVKALVEDFFQHRDSASWLLLKGVHAPTQTVKHQLFGKNGVYQSFECERLLGEYHGSGCTLASAIAAYLVLGESVQGAVERAQNYVFSALKQAFQYGKGQYLPNRFNVVGGAIHV
jgi:hydroxymethylpyrimidine/phosphomethylpyrimidine kinase